MQNAIVSRQSAGVHAHAQSLQGLPTTFLARRCRRLHPRKAAIRKLWRNWAVGPSTEAAVIPPDETSLRFTRGFHLLPSCYVMAPLSASSIQKTKTEVAISMGFCRKVCRDHRGGTGMGRELGASSTSPEYAMSQCATFPWRRWPRPSGRARRKSCRRGSRHHASPTSRSRTISSVFAMS